MPSYAAVRRRVARGAGALLVSVLATACVDLGYDEEASPSAPGDPLAGVPDINIGQRVDLIGRLKAIDPGLVKDEQLTLLRARYVCKRIYAGQTDATLARYVREQFIGGPVTGLTPAGAAGIVAAIQASFCPRP